MSVPYLSKAGHVAMAKAAHRQMLDYQFLNIQSMVAVSRMNKEFHLKAARAV